MARNLVIVESPAKARTISKFLGRGFTVKASMGHVRDLPRSQFGVDVEDGFTPKYITVRGQGKTLQELRKAVKSADRVLLATDPDREGEAISWHLAEALDLPGDAPNRIEFHEITKPAVQKAIKNPRTIDENLVNAQQARRILDRLVGYGLSPLLWNKVKRGLSAGRVQSVALRIICDREKEIEAFVPEEYWSLTAELDTGDAKERFEAKLHQIDGKKAELKTEADAEAVVQRVTGKEFRVAKVARRERRRNAQPPFTTSTLQQEASRRLGFTARRTMSVAQQLYEGLEVKGEGTIGLITYLRTDATRVSEEAQTEARSFIEETWGKSYVPKSPPEYKSRAGAQGAHEAIRPTSALRRPETIKEDLTRDQYRLYKLIWDRFIASQMSPAILDTLTIDVEANGATFRASGSTVKFPGFMAVYQEERDDDEAHKASVTEAENATLPDLEEGSAVYCRKLDPKQHFTQPPPRYTEAMLVKSLEELGIGRPSTYVQIIDTLQRRGYTSIREKRFYPTELGHLIVDLLKEHFPDIVDVEFTAGLEEKLDKIEEGALEWRRVLTDFYVPFKASLEQAKDLIDEVKVEDEVTDEVCEVCGRNMVIKWGRYGKFLACPGFPECKHTRPLLEEVGVDCPDCGRPIVVRRSRKGRVFYGCSGYPECSFTSWQKPVKRRCPECGGLMGEAARRGKGTEYVCLDKACGHREAAPEEAGDERLEAGAGKASNGALPSGGGTAGDAAMRGAGRKA